MKELQNLIDMIVESTGETEEFVSCIIKAAYQIGKSEGYRDAMKIYKGE